LEKIKVFISSRVNSVLTGLPGQHTLTELRRFLCAELQKQVFLGEQVLEVLINEETFTGALNQNAFDNCMRELRSANIVIILYNGEAGWAIAGSTSANGICHEEALVAMSEFSEMSYVIDLRAFATLPETGDAAVANANFSKDMTDAFPTIVAIPANNFEELQAGTLSQAQRLIWNALNKAMTTQKQIVKGSGVFGATLDWSKMTYAERKASLEKQLSAVFDPLAGFEQVFKRFHGIPDNMSVADARNMIGRPFLSEHTDIQDSNLKSGIIHFVAVYGNITEGQAKGLVGYPDLTVIKATFGLYLWEKNIHIQIFFVKGCINPQMIKTRFSEVTNWIKGSREEANILSRAASRFAILDTINKVNAVKKPKL
jgi:hypothetical protein